MGKLHPLHPLHHPSYNHLQRSIDHNTPHKPYTTLTRSRIFRQWSAQITSSSSRSSSVPPAQLYEQPTPSAQPPSQAPLSSTGAPLSSRAFSTTPRTLKGLSPESADPPPKESEPEAYEPTSSSEPADISIEEYHELSDAYLNGLIEKLEQLQEEREEVDVEYSAGVLTLAFPPNGTYVLNKQPPNKQIWLSSPITGPKRYDYVLLSEGQDAKEGTGRGEWVYLRDGSSLTELLEKEIGIVIDESYDGTVEE